MHLSALWILRLPALLAALGIVRPAHAAPMPAAPIVLSLDPLRLPPHIAAVALHPGRRAVYIGIGGSYDPARQNLVVVPLDSAGHPSGPPRRFADSADPVDPGNHSSVYTILPSPTHRKLYLSGVQRYPGPDASRRVLTVYDLDDAGQPQGAPRSYDMGSPQKVLDALALHPTRPLLYLSGWGSAAIHAYALDPRTGEPVGPPRTYPIGTGGKTAIGVSPDGRLLYLGTYPETLEVVPLDARGAPQVAAGLRQFRAALSPGVEPGYLRFQHTPGALYRVPDRGGSFESPLAPLSIWPLGSDGLPAPTDAGPRPLPHLRQRAFAAGAVGAAPGLLYRAEESTFPDAFTGAAVVDGTALVAQAADGARVLLRLPRQQAVLMAPAPGGSAVLLTRALEIPPQGLGNHARGTRLRVTLRALPDAPAGPVPVWIDDGHADRRPISPGLAAGVPSPWIDLDGWLRGVGGQRVLRLGVLRDGPAAARRLGVTIEVAEADPAGLRRTLTETVQGDAVRFLVPGYGYEPWTERGRAIETLSAHTEGQLQVARRDGLPVAGGPREFVVSCSHLLGGQGHLGQLRAAAELVSRVGCNTVNAFRWEPLPSQTISATLDEFGLRRRALAVYAPPGQFAFEAVMQDAALDTWAQGLIRGAAFSERVVELKLADEPGWYYPGEIDRLRTNPAGLLAFRAYLAARGLTPADLGQATWDAVTPGGAGAFAVGSSAAADLPARRRLYWTARFFTESASRGMQRARQALERALGRPLSAPVNWSNFLSAWYLASPGQRLYNNTAATADAGVGGHDWLLAGRLGAHTLWTEDWFADAEAQRWSYVGDALRSAAELGEQGFGGYVVGRMIGDLPAGASYKILSLVGHGAKQIDVYAYGPELLFPGNGWSERTAAYGPLSRALDLVRRGERLLYPGRPARGRVALHLPAASALWNDGPDPRYYGMDVERVHQALGHAGHTMDLVDDQDLEDGALETRGYAALYLSGPNLSRRAQEQVAAWVRAGGTLAVGPDAAVADEYNTPTVILDAVLGLGPRRARREAVSSPAVPEVRRLAVQDARFGERGERGSVAVFGPYPPALELAGAAVAAQLVDRRGAAQPGLTVNRHGRGLAIAYGFYPGWQYARTAQRAPHHLPSGWGAAQRRLAVAPAELGLSGQPRAVQVNRPGVEALRLQSAAGIAVVLLNWSGADLADLEVTVRGVERFRRVQALQAPRLSSAARTEAGGDVTVTARLPLRDVDVLMLEPAD